MLPPHSFEKRYSGGPKAGVTFLLSLRKITHFLFPRKKSDAPTSYHVRIFGSWQGNRPRQAFKNILCFWKRGKPSWVVPDNIPVRRAYTTKPRREDQEEKEGIASTRGGKKFFFFGGGRVSWNLGRAFTTRMPKKLIMQTFPIFSKLFDLPATFF